MTEKNKDSAADVFNISAGPFLLCGPALTILCSKLKLNYPQHEMPNFCH